MTYIVKSARKEADSASDKALTICQKIWPSNRYLQNFNPFKLPQTQLKKIIGSERKLLRVSSLNFEQVCEFVGSYK